MVSSQFTAPAGAAPESSSHTQEPVLVALDPDWSVMDLARRLTRGGLRLATGQAGELTLVAHEAATKSAQSPRVVDDADALKLSQGYDLLLEADSFLNVLTDALHDRLEDKAADYTNVIDAARAKLKATWEALDYAGFNTCTALRLEEAGVRPIDEAIDEYRREQREQS